MCYVNHCLHGPSDTYKQNPSTVLTLSFMTAVKLSVSASKFFLIEVMVTEAINQYTMVCTNTVTSC